VCIDLAIQCSPDHPWLKEHPEWFHRRPDGTLKYAENPPKKYQDIYNVNWDSPDWRALWEELRRVVQVWVDRGVKVFRVDNPHTKPVAFWRWLIGEIRAGDPDVIFLSEAFTRPAMMQTLGKVGFAQSYTYFTWKNTRAELTEFIEQIVPWSPYYRPNFFVNTQDILHEYLQTGIYSGFEWAENVPLREGSEEYLDSEKYELKQRTLEGAPLLPLARRLNEIRRKSPALQRFDNVSLLETESEHLFAFAKRADGDTVFCVVNLDAAARREGLAIVPAWLGLPPVFAVRDELDGSQYTWHTGRNYAALDPGQAHLMRVVR
jgi:starch synthase (maltosyl-transferring)